MTITRPSGGIVVHEPHRASLVDGLDNILRRMIDDAAFPVDISRIAGPSLAGCL